MSNPSGAKANRWVAPLIGWFHSMNYTLCERRALCGTKDKGDLAGLPYLMVEAKNVNNITLASFADETETERINAGARWGVCLIHRRLRPPAKCYALMSGENWADMYFWAQRGLATVPETNDAALTLAE